MMEKLLLLDSNSLLHRAYYALQSSNLTDSKGNPTGAVYGFVSMFARLVHEEKPTHVAATFDLKAPTFRHKMYEAYKGTRKPMPDDLAAQVPVLKKLVAELGVKIVELEGYEADDILGTLSDKFDVQTVIVTGDRDSLQLIDDNTVVLYTKRGITDVVRYDRERLKEEGFTPEKIIDYKALRGDVSDNIPGIPGIGEKTALNLLNEYGTLEKVLENAESVPGKLGEKIRDGKDSARLSYELATIKRDVPIAVELDDLSFGYPLPAAAKKALETLEFSSLVKRFDFADVNNKDTSVNKIECKTIELDDIGKIKALVSENVGKPFAIYVDDLVRLAFGNDTEYVIRQNYDLFGGITTDDILKEIAPLFKKGRAITFDFKKLLHAFDNSGIEIPDEADDVLLMGYLVFGGRNFPDIAALANAVGTDGKSVATFFGIKEILSREIKNKEMQSLYGDIELPLERVLFDMERTGIKVDRKVLDGLKEKYEDEIEKLTAEIYGFAGEKFNINSPKQLTVILFEKLGLKPSKKNKSGLSVNVEVLEKLYDEHPIIPLILRYRQISKLLSTYVLGLEKAISSDGRIHTEYKQMLTNTGRLSSTEPNLQNIPTRTAEGKEIRRAFVADEGKVLISADYSQIELRLIASMSGDENLIRAYNESRDIHATTAAEIYGVDEKDVTPEMRRNAKAVNFGIIYGISDFGLAQNLSIRPKEAKAYIEKYFETYPKVKSFMDGQVEFASANGFVRTLFNRIRIMSELSSGNYAVREFGKRASMNFPLQGTAADIIKIAMLDTAKNLEKTGAKLLLQVHDELIVEANEKNAEEVKDILKKSMENAVKLKVPLTVDVESGKNWYEA